MRKKNLSQLKKPTVPILEKILPESVESCPKIIYNSVLYTAKNKGDATESLATNNGDQGGGTQNAPVRDNLAHIDAIESI